MGERQNPGLVREILAERLKPLRGDRRVGANTLRQFVSLVRYEAVARLAKAPNKSPKGSGKGNEQGDVFVPAMVDTVAVLPDGLEWHHVRQLAGPLLTANDPKGFLIGFKYLGDRRFRFGVPPS